MKLSEAIKVVLTNGASVEFKHRHIYKNTKGKYSILFFDGDGNIKTSIPEETFEDLDKALVRFMGFFK